MIPKVDRLIGDKILLRIPKISDIPFLCKWFNDDSVLKYSRHRSRGVSEEEQTKIYRNTLSDPNKVQFTIEELKLAKPIGTISFTIASDAQSADISIIVGEEDYWSKGIATDAIRILVEYGVRYNRIRRFTAGWDVRNVGSKIVFERNGFRVFETLPKSIEYLDDDKLYDKVRSNKLM